MCLTEILVRSSLDSLHGQRLQVLQLLAVGHQKGNKSMRLPGNHQFFAGHKEVAVPFSVTAAFVMSSGQATS